MLRLLLLGSLINYISFKSHPLSLFSHPKNEQLQLVQNIFNNFLYFLPTDKTFTATPLLSPPPVSPLPINSGDPAFIAKRVNNLNIHSLLEQSTLISTGLLEKKFTKPFLAFALPLFILLFFKKQKKYAHNINVNIPALIEKKVYRITLEKNHTSVNTAFEVVAGEPLRLLQSNKPTLDAYEGHTLYNKKDSIIKKFLWEPIANNILKQEQHYLILNINIKEILENVSLAKETKTYSLSITDKELIRINHLPNNFTEIQKELKLHDKNNDDEFCLRKITTDLHPTSATKQALHIPLPPLNSSALSSENEYLHIEEL